MVVVIRHYGLPFTSDENALLVATGMFHHIIIIR
jgi:hypothetical protein